MIDVSLVAPSDASLDFLIDHALLALTALRGGGPLHRDIEALCGSSEPQTIARSLRGTQSLIGARDEDQWVGVAAVSQLSVATVIGIYVTEECRRRGVGRSLVQFAREHCGACDGWASPGDRATKSLYEAAGWRARLLTMSDGAG